MKLSLILTIALLSSVHVNAAWDGTNSGKIHGIDVAAPGDNYGFRISLDDGTTKMCGNNHTWAYLNETDSNYQTFVSVLLAAKMAEKSVIVYTNKDSSSNEYCHIGYIGMR